MDQATSFLVHQSPLTLRDLIRSILRQHLTQVVFRWACPKSFVAIGKSALFRWTCPHQSLPTSSNRVKKHPDSSLHFTVAIRRIFKSDSSQTCVQPRPIKRKLQRYRLGEKGQGFHRLIPSSLNELPPWVASNPSRTRPAGIFCERGIRVELEEERRGRNPNISPKPVWKRPLRTGLSSIIFHQPSFTFEPDNSRELALLFMNKRVPAWPEKPHKNGHVGCGFRVTSLMIHFVKEERERSVRRRV